MRVIRAILVFIIFAIGLKGYAQTLVDHTGEIERLPKENLLDTQVRYELDLDLKAFPSSNVLMNLPGPITVFANSEVWFFAGQDTTILMPLSSIKNSFAGEELSLIFMGEKLSIEDFKVQKVLSSANLPQAKKTSNVLEVRQGLTKSSLNNVFFVGVIIILFLTAIYRMAYPFLFASMTQPLSLINAEDFSQSGSLQKFFSLDILLFVMITNLLLGMISLVGLALFQDSWVSNWTGFEFWPLAGLWLLLSFAFFLITIVKFSFLRTTAFVFDLGRVPFSHFFYLLRILIIGSGILLLIIAFFLVNNFDQSQEALNLLLQAIFWLYLLGVFMLFIIMSNRFSFNKYHLFTYLCLAEMVPFLVFAKIIMNLGQ
ncbi:DUF4271 domain-containing protein [Algoriphagus sediminis]|uniref:DUF4271 domain-containing protein n=1 Tax=Algoriphagus sediminis TaxID=3057113 RepID=A0ABT7YEK3_9BACT|nr:DUF4271 domain-containing protein [Algoriphagus sediminis]MDN3204896.1 DUF4271 domain-containing protein [Algoriphagus sediminis]